MAEEAKNRVSVGLVFAVACLVTGNLVGAGILALPINTGLAGVLPSLIGMLVVGAAMFYSAFILAGKASATREENFNYPSLYHQYLGVAGKWIAILANLLILYGLLTAYLTGAAAIVIHVFGVPADYMPLVIIACFVLFTALAIGDISIIHKYNSLLMVLLWVSFLIMVAIAEKQVHVEHMAYTDWCFLPVAVPIIVTAFHFHNIIPTVCHNLKWDMSAVWKAMLIGMIIGFMMNILWIQVGVGVLPIAEGPNSLLHAYKVDLPATVPMAKVVKSKLFLICSMVFAFLAITTSYLANGLGLLGFMSDLVSNYSKRKNRLPVIALCFCPPLLISMFYPQIFLEAINIVGGVGIVTLFGILPAIIGIINAKTKLARIVGVAMLLLFTAFLGIEVAHELGYLKLKKPDVEYWKHHYHKTIEKK